MRKYLMNDEMAKAFGGYDFLTHAMKAVCKAQRELTIKEAKSWLGSLPIEPKQKIVLQTDLDIMTL